MPERPVSRPAFVALLAVYVVFRLYLATLPGYVNDVQSYKRWSLGVATHGLDEAYATVGFDYPPLFLYVLHPVGKLYLAFVPATGPDEVPDSTLFTLLIKSPGLVFDLLAGALLYALVARGGLWGRSRSAAAWGRLACLLYLWNPAVLWDSGYWGQPDSIHSALVLAAVAALAFEHSLGSGALLSAAGMMKPLAAPLIPLVAVVEFARRGIRGAACAAAGAVAVVLLAFLPFFLAGRGAETVQFVLFWVEGMPYASVNAHNLWWLLAPWRDANTAILGPLTPKHIGVVLFLGATAALLVRSLRWMRSRNLAPEAYRARIFALAAAISCGFFFLSTHMHENHLFMALPLLLALAGRDRRAAWLAVGCSLAVLANVALHDLDFPYRLPWLLRHPSPLENPHLHVPFTWLQLVGSVANTVLVGAVAAGSYVRAWRDGG